MRFISIILFYTALFVSPASAQHAAVPGADQWMLSYEQSYNICLVHATYKQSRTFMAFATDGSRNHFILANPSWSLPEKSRYVISMRFDSSRLYRLPVQALGKEMLGAELSQIGEKEFRQSRHVEVFGESGNLVGNFSLRGSNRAIELLTRCGAVAQETSMAADPFARRVINPFD